MLKLIYGKLTTDISLDRPVHSATKLKAEWPMYFTLISGRDKGHFLFSVPRLSGTKISFVRSVEQLALAADHPPESKNAATPHCPLTYWWHGSYLIKYRENSPFIFTTHTHIVLLLRMCAAVPLLPHTPSQHYTSLHTWINLLYPLPTWTRVTETQSIPVFNQLIEVLLHVFKNKV